MRPSVLSHVNSAKVTLGIVAIVYLFPVLAALYGHGYGPSYSVTAGDQYSDPNLVPKNLQVLRHSPGYDGEFYYRLALNPFTSSVTEFGVTLDYPAYRQQRIIYPLVVWTLSLGQPDLVPGMLILVNYIGLCLLGWLGGLYAQSLKHHAFWGLVFPLYPGLLLTLLRDLAEILAMCLLLASLLSMRRHKELFAAFLLTLALLTKETTFLAAVAGLCVWFVGTWKDKSGNPRQWYFYVVPITAWFIWQLLWLRVWGQFPVLAGPPNLGLPLSGFVRFLQFASARTTLFQQLAFTELCFIILFAIAVVNALRSTIASSYEKFTWFLYVGLATLLTGAVWVEDWAFLRILSEFYVLGTVILIGSQSRLKIPVFAYALILWLFLAVDRALM